MNDNEYPSSDLRVSPRATEDSGALQFSLASLFVIITTTAVILAIYFGVGRLVGMTTFEVLTQGLGRLLFVAPTLLVWLVGFSIAFQRLRRDRLPAILTMFALSGFVLTSLTLEVVQMALIHMVHNVRLDHEVISWSFFILGGLQAIVHATCWILILAAVFVRRPPAGA